MKILSGLLALCLQFATPAWATHIGTEDFTAYTEVDPGADIAITASTITATTIDHDSGAHVYYDYGTAARDSKYFTAVRARFTTQSSFLSTSASEFCLFALANDVGACRGDWNADYIVVSWLLTTSTAALRVRTNDGNDAGITVDTSSNLSASTLYYVEIRWTATLVVVLIYSDSGFSTLVDTLTLTGADVDATYQVVYGFSTHDDFSAGRTATVSVSDLTVYRFVFNGFTYMNRVIPADNSDDFETYPGDWLETEEGSSTVAQSTDVSVSGSNSLKCTGVGSDRAYAYDSTYTANGENSLSVSAAVRVASLDDGGQAAFFTARDPANAYAISAAAYRSGSTYSWRVVWNDGTSVNTTNADTIDTLALNTWYTIELRFYHSASLAAKEALSLSVNGTTIIEIDPAGVYDGISFERAFICDTIQTGLTLDSVRYVDDFVWQADEYALNNGLVRTDAGTFCAASRWAYSHGWQADAGGIQINRSTDGGATWTNEDLVDETNPDDDRAFGGLITDGSTIYLFNQYRDDNETSIWATSIWVSSDQCQSFSKVSSSENIGWNVKPSLIENGVILSPGYEVDADNSDNVTKLFSYTIATNAWAVVSTMATAGDYTDAFPNEAGCLRQSSDGKLACLIRWDEYTGTDQLFETYQTSDDNGATWNAATDLSSQWGMRGGTITNFESIAGSLYLQGYLRNGISRTMVMQVDPSTLDILNEVGWAYSAQLNEAGNGQLVDGGFDANGDYHIYYLADAVTAVFYDIILPVSSRAAGTPRGGPMILRNYVGGNYALDH